MVDALESERRRLKLADLKRRIAAGTYETPDKLEAAVDKLLSTLDPAACPKSDGSTARKRPK